MGFDAAAKELDEMSREFLKIYDEYLELELRTKQVKEMMGMKKEEIISAMNTLGMTSRDIDGAKLVKCSSTHPSVRNFKALENYIRDVLNEPISAYQTTSFDRKALKQMVDNAMKDSVSQNVPISELLPDGLDISMTTYLQVRGYKKSGNSPDDEAPF